MSYTEMNSNNMINPARTTDTSAPAVNINKPVTNPVMEYGHINSVDMARNNINMVSQHLVPHCGERQNANTEPMVWAPGSNNHAQYADTPRTVSQHSEPATGERMNAINKPEERAYNKTDLDRFVGQPLIKKAQENYPLMPTQLFCTGPGHINIRESIYMRQ